MPAALPQFGQLQAPADWQAIDFISDLHLSADTPATFDALAAYLKSTSANAVFILGDLFEVWVGDDARDDDFERRCTALLHKAATRTMLAFMAGNRDFLVGPDMLRDCGMTALHDPTLFEAFGRRTLLTHGDALCLADTDYQQFRAVVRGDPWQREFLSQTLAQRRVFARQLRNQSEQRKREGRGPSDWADIDPGAALHWLLAADASVLVHGHTHRPGSEALALGITRHVLSDWDLDHAPHRAEVLRWTATGFERLPLNAAMR